MNNENDRSRLLLLNHLAEKSRRDRKELQTLEALYPDNEQYEDELKNKLFKGGYLYREDLTPDLPSLNEQGYVNEEKRYSAPITSPSGIVALRTGAFVSESAQNARDKRDRRLNLVYKIAAIVGGLLGIANFIWMFFAQFHC